MKQGEGSNRSEPRIQGPLENWKEHIFAYFNVRYTNAATEALNGIAKLKHRMGRGYSFEVIRAKVLFSKRRHKWARPLFEPISFDDTLMGMMVMEPSSVNLGTRSFHTARRYQSRSLLGPFNTFCRIDLYCS
jgi:hypothetical protein